MNFKKSRSVRVTVILRTERQTDRHYKGNIPLRSFFPKGVQQEVGKGKRQGMYSRTADLQ